MDLKIGVYRVRGRLTPLRGEPLEVALFVHPAPGSMPTATALRRLLNDPAASFLPCEVAGETRLVCVDWIAYLTFALEPAPESGDEDARAARADVVLDLVTGQQLAGSLLYHGRPEDRVSDYLNARAQRFLPIRNRDGRHEVHRRAIEQIRL